MYKSKKSTYGLYGVGVYLFSFGIIVLIGTVAGVFGFANHKPIFLLLGFGTVLYGIISTSGWYFGRYVIPGTPVDFARKVISSLSLNGTEKVLDVGTGRGLFAVEIAKRLMTGTVIGIDVWQPESIKRLTFVHKWTQPTGNSKDRACLNAKIERVEEKVKFIDMDASHLDFGENTFDLVVCGYVIGHLGRHGKKALNEINRVLKPAGKLVIVDNVRDLTYFLMSTPHLFFFSYLRGKKAKRLTSKYWISMLSETGFKLYSSEQARGIIVIEADKK
jgi:ubiquinone/menaquinone biosynthesis C-methylase UbiE